MSEDRTQQLPDDGVRLILARLDSMDVRFDSVDARLDSMDARFNSMEARLTTLEEKVDLRLQETRPIWEQVLVRLTNVEQELIGVKEGLARVETRLEKVEDEVDTLGRRFRVFNKDILKLQNQDDDLTERMDKIEAERAR